MLKCLNCAEYFDYLSIRAVVSLSAPTCTIACNVKFYLSLKEGFFSGKSLQGVYAIVDRLPRLEWEFRVWAFAQNTNEIDPSDLVHPNELIRNFAVKWKKASNGLY